MYNKITKTTKEQTKNQTTSAQIAKTQVARAQVTKAQVAAEFFLYAGVFILVIITTFSVVSFLQSSEIQFREATLAKEVGTSFAESVNLAVSSGEGFRYNFTFKVQLFSRPYEIVFDKKNNRMFFNWEGTYGNATNVYPIIAYNYQYAGCASNGVLVSKRCKNMLLLYNDGNTLFIEQPSE